MFGVPIAAAAAVDRLHIAPWSGRIVHVTPFLFDASNETPVAFLIRGILNVAHLIMPAWNGPPGPAMSPLAAIDRRASIALLAVAGVCIAGIAGAARSLNSRRVAVVLVVFAITLALNAVTGLARQYPFGGELRHEFSGFRSPSWVSSASRNQPGGSPEVDRETAGLGRCLTLGLLFNALSWTLTTTIASSRLFRRQMDHFAALVGSQDAVLSISINFINVFTYHDDWNWRVIHQDETFWQVWLATRAGQSLIVCRDRRALGNGYVGARHLPRILKCRRTQRPAG